MAQAHSVVLAHLQRIAAQCPVGAYEEGIKLYEQADVSAKIQTVLQVSSSQPQPEIFHKLCFIVRVRSSSDLKIYKTKQQLQ